jgi:3-hydroxyisobutyrate dehydrogenase-like beta-hydroxyacid dehydrogenase
MADVTMIGLGAMGTALAQAFIGAGHTVTVWNRTPARTKPLVALGAVAARSPADAAASSPVGVICIDNYDATRRLIEDSGMLEVLSGRMLVQLSTGTPNEARDLSHWLTGHGVRLLDGAIMRYPDGIGAVDAQILFAGPADLYGACKPVLDCLGGDLRHVSEEIGAAAVLDMALLTHQLSNYLGVWHGVRVCEAEGLGVDIFASMFPRDDPAAHLAWRIYRNDYDDPGATLEVWNAALDGIIEHAENAGINREIPELISSLFRRAIALGHGRRDLASVIEVLRAAQ